MPTGTLPIILNETRQAVAKVVAATVTGKALTIPVELPRMTQAQFEGLKPDDKVVCRRTRIVWTVLRWEGNYADLTRPNPDIRNEPWNTQVFRCVWRYCPSEFCLLSEVEGRQGYSCEVAA